MKISDFTERTNYTPTYQEFCSLEDIYGMYEDDIDKFCENFLVLRYHLSEQMYYAIIDILEEYRYYFNENKHSIFGLMKKLRQVTDVLDSISKEFNKVKEENNILTQKIENKMEE